MLLERAVATGSRLLLIGLVAPAAVHIIGIVAYSIMLLFTAIVSYPVMVVASLLLLLPLHYLFTRMMLHPITQLPIIGICGFVGGYIVLWCLNPQVAMSDTLTSRLAIEYATLGLFAGVCCWVLYNWGPLRIAEARSNSSSSGREGA